MNTLKKLMIGAAIMLLNASITLSEGPNSKRLLLSTLRGGDYAHAGDVASIDLVLHKVLALNPHIKSGNVLDVGCGFGGTLDYLRHAGFQSLTGVDINPESINYAKLKYPDIQFNTYDALTIDGIYKGHLFDLAIMMNTIYAIENKAKLLKALSAISKPGSILAMFDYSVSGENKVLQTLDFAGKAMRPIELQSFRRDLEQACWRLVESQDFSDEFTKWYREFLVSLRQKRSILEKNFNTKDIDEVEGSFSYFLEQIIAKRMGGVVIYAIKEDMSR